MTREKKVDWALVIRDIVQKLVAWVGKSKPSSICPYIFYLYHLLNTLRGEEITIYQVCQTMIKYDFDLDPELESMARGKFECESLNPKEIVALQRLTTTPKGWLKKIP